MARPLISEYLVTHTDDPMKVDRGVYVIQWFGPLATCWRINLPACELPETRHPFIPILQMVNGGGLSHIFNQPIKMHVTGLDMNEFFIIHDQSMRFAKSKKFASTSSFLQTTIKNIGEEASSFSPPALWKLVCGSEHLNKEDIDEYVQKKKWKLVSAPEYFVFGADPLGIYNEILRVGVVDARPNWFFGKLNAGRQFMKILMNVVSGHMLHFMRAALFVQYVSRNQQSIDLEFFEKVVDVHLATHGLKVGEVEDIFSNISPSEVDRKHRRVKRKILGVSAMKQNQRIRRIAQTIGLNLYRYDAAIAQQLTANRKSPETAASRKLVRDIEAHEDIVKGSDQSRPWDDQGT